MLLNHGLLLLAVPLPLNVVLAPIQTSVAPLMLGNDNTVTTTSSVFTQPFASVPVTVYVLVTVGLNTTPLLTPLFHVYVLAPEPLNVTSPPLHTVWSEPALTLGKAYTVTVCWLLPP